MRRPIWAKSLFALIPEFHTRLSLPILKLNPAKSRLHINQFSFVKSLWNFAQSTAVSLLCSEQNFKTTQRLKWVFWKNEISRDLSLGWVSGPILQQSTPEFHISVLTAAAVPYKHFYVSSPFSLCYTRLAIHGGGSNLGRYGPHYHCVTSLMKRLCFVLTHGIPVFCRWRTQTWSSSFLILYIPFPYIAMTS